MRIRPLHTHAEYLEAERLQKEVWGFPDREIIPLNELVVARRIGGLVFGAFEGRQMAAFCFGVPASLGGRPYHYSRMLGVRARWRHAGLGRRMKLYQRAWVLRRGMDLIRWTFDPLQTANVQLNVARLGVVVREYLVDFYGPSQSRFNQGVGSDRLVAEWWIRSPRVRERIAGRGGMTLAEARRHVTLEVPNNIDEIKARRPREAKAWRRRLCKAFLDLFRRGYLVTDFVRHEPYSLYVLQARCASVP